MRWRAYLQYSHMDRPWLDRLPRHWGLKRIKHTTYVKGRIGWQGLRSDEFCDEGPYLVTGTDFADGRINWESCYHVSESRYSEDPYIQLREGDLLITKDGTIGKVAVVSEMPGQASLNSGIFVARPMTADYTTEFLYWVLRSAVFTGFIDYNKAGSTISHLYQNVFVEFAFPVPSLQEQYAIAAFLDRETARIDALVAAKERQIALLQEKRAALISHAVTSGLDPSVPMKDSGVEWLGMVPLHWEIRALKTIAELQRGHDLPTQERESGAVPVVSSAGISDYHAAAKVAGPGVVTGRYGTIGQVFYIDQDYWPLNTTLYVRDFKGNHPRYIYYLLTILPFDAYSGKSAVPGVDRNDLHVLSMVCPPYSEQCTIAVFLDQEMKRIDTLIKKIQNSIEGLHEYRAALISAAVTGKIDVRQEVGS